MLVTFCLSFSSHVFHPKIISILSVLYSHILQMSQIFLIAPVKAGVCISSVMWCYCKLFCRLHPNCETAAAIMMTKWGGIVSDRYNYKNIVKHISYNIQYFSKPGDTFLVLPRRRNATACPAWRRLGLPCAALPGQARRTHTHALGR